jgi:hypothetical protein
MASLLLSPSFGDRARFDWKTTERTEGGGDCDEESAGGLLLLHAEVVLLTTEAFMVGRWK